MRKNSTRWALRFRNGSAARALLDRTDHVHHERRREPIDSEVHVREVAAADAELALEVVAGRDPREHLHRAQGVVGQDAAKVLKLRARKGLL